LENHSGEYLSKVSENIIYIPETSQRYDLLTVSTFFLVSLSVGGILGEINLTWRKKKLDVVTRGESLGGTYTATISGFKSLQGGRSKLGMGGSNVGIVGSGGHYMSTSCVKRGGERGLSTLIFGTFLR